MAIVTIKDLARECGVSVSTVSKALHNMPDVSAETRKAVLAVAQKRKYRANPYASALPRQSSRLIGVIVPVITHHLFTGIITGIQAVTRSCNYNVIVSESDHSTEREEMTLASLLGMRISGLLIGPFAENESHTEYVAMAQQDGIPVVFFDGAYEKIQASRVIVNDFEATIKAVEHLVKTGCRKIAHISGPKHSYIGKQRILGYRAALHKFGLPYRKDWVVESDFSIANAILVAHQLLTGPEIPNAIIAVNDLSAIGALKAAQEKGLSVPHDLSLIGYSDNPFSTIVEPTISSIRQPAIEMGNVAAELLINQIEHAGAATPPVIRQLPTELILRNSTKPYPLAKG